LAVDRHRAVDALEGVFGQHAVMTDALDFEQTPVGLEADVADLGQIVQALADAKVVGVVDGGLGT